MDSRRAESISVNRTRREFLLASGKVLTAASLPMSALAQQWPTKPIRLVAAQAPGSSNDATARALAEFLTAELKTPVVVENKPGGLGMIAADTVARSVPDGYTLLITLHSQLAQAPVLLKKAPIDPAKDLIPVGTFNTGVSLGVVKKDLPVSNLKELIELSKTRPVSVGNYGVGSGWQMMIMQLAKRTGGQFDIVTYKGTGPMALDLMAGNIDMGAGSMVGLAGGIQRGSFKPVVMIQGSRGNPLAPGVPSWADEGFKGPAFQSLLESNMVLAPRGTPAELVQRLGDLIQKSAHSSEKVKAVLAQLGVTDSPTLTGPALKEFIAQTWPAFQGMTRELNIVTE